MRSGPHGGPVMRLGDLVDGVGGLMTFSATTLRVLARPPFQTRELVQQTEFIAVVSVLPAMLVSIPFGAVIALQLGNLTKQLGAESFTGRPPHSPPSARRPRS